ncbi:AraC family transcriptional regulator [Paenibacillus agricola]|uniref:AraC family transcriptional regulator n=1 Tax=Paenibacillus agricola TaxID=2716264 RepID=A0ABX0JAX1_9BACL|nr:AraC family transcriptional regulator [Paenibacillus agricola]NHN32916.1 AraC family transcriptional regulator [Paenibacillus agricola]
MKPMLDSPTSYSLCCLTSIRHRRHHQQNVLSYTKIPASMLIFITEGTGSLLINNECFDFEPLQLYYLTPGMQIDVSLGSECLAYYSLQLAYYGGAAGESNGDSIHLHNKELPLFTSGRVQVTNARPLLKRIELLYDNSVSQTPTFQHHLQFQELLYFIMQEGSKKLEESSSLQGIQQAAAYIQAHFHEQLEMKTLAVMAGLTPSSFSRLFKKMMGESPLAYWVRLRMESAKELLSHKDCRIKEVSASVGYDDEFYFSRVFHRTVGISPSFYMNRKKMKIAVVSCTLLQDSLLSLGIEPVAAVNCCRYPGMDDAEYEQLLANNWAELQHAQPDLIIGDVYHQPFYQQLNCVASSVILLTDTDWLVNYRKMGAMLGQHQEAAYTLGQLALRIAAARRILNHSMKNKTVSVLQVNHQHIRIQGTINHPLNELIYQDLGLKPGLNVPLHTKILDLPPEWLPPLEADYVFMLKKNAGAGSEAIYERMRKTEAWKSIRAVQNGKVMLIPQWIRMSWTPTGRTAIIDELLKMTDTRSSLVR